MIVFVVSVAITGIGPDFTRLESFGKVDAFAESLVINTTKPHISSSFFSSI